MSTLSWRCDNCGLFNYSTASNCVACFNVPSTISTRNIPWTQLKSVPISARMGKAISIYENEFILVTTPYKFAGDDTEPWSKIWFGILKYNVKTNDWCKWIEYDRPLGIFAGITYNKEDGKLFWVGYKGEIYIFDIEHQKTKTIKGLSNTAGSYKNVMMINKNIHLITPDHKHLICNVYDNDDNIKIREANDTDIDMLAPKNIYSDRDTKNIYIRSRNVIMAVVCVDYTFNLRWAESQENMIMIYSIRKREWTIMKDLQMKQRKMEVPKILVTSDEKYAIIIGEFELTKERYYGWDKVDDKWNFEGEQIPIYVLEICDDDKYKLKQCMIELPMKRPFSVAMTAGVKDEYELLVNGYLRMIDDNYSSPMDVIKEILKWITDDMIHWVEYGSGGKSERHHFAMSLSNLLSYCD